MYFCTQSISHQNYKNMLKATPANLKKLEILFKDPLVIRLFTRKDIYSQDTVL